MAAANEERMAALEQLTLELRDRVEALEVFVLFCFVFFLFFLFVYT
jgi:hypothetical protein